MPVSVCRYPKGLFLLRILLYLVLLELISQVLLR